MMALVASLTLSKTARITMMKRKIENRRVMKKMVRKKVCKCCDLSVSGSHDEKWYPSGKSGTLKGKVASLREK